MIVRRSHPERLWRRIGEGKCRRREPTPGDGKLNDQAKPSASSAAPWWERADRHYDEAGDLWIAGRRLRDLLPDLQTPCFLYSAARIRQNIARFRGALVEAGIQPRIYYAMKANRFGPLLDLVREQGLGIDAASPGEVALALSHGFDAAALSFTAGSLSRRDFNTLKQWPQITLNIDSIAELARWAEIAPGRRLGIRVNPSTGVAGAGNPLLAYAGAKPSKFGVYLDRFEEALQTAADLGLHIEGLHCHAGCGLLNEQLDQLEAVFERLDQFVQRAPGIRRLNLGGGLGIALEAQQEPLAIERWAALVAAYFGQRGLQLEFEPGDYLVKDAGTLVTEITHVEDKGGVRFVGVDSGWNLHPEPVFYQRPFTPLSLCRAEPAAPPVNIVGNINEALDVLAEQIELPPLRAGQHLAWLNAGGYAAAMASSHCLRGEFQEILIEPALLDRPPAAAQLSSSNQQAWNELYRGHAQRIWGDQMLPFLPQFAAAIEQVLGQPSRLLDAGVGEGRNLPFLHSLGADEVHGLDSAAAALAKVPEALRHTTNLHCAELDSSGLDAASFDAITLLDTVETLPNIAAVLAEMRRLLRPGGLLLCNIPGMDDGVSGLDMRAMSDNAYLYRDRYYFRFYAPDEAAQMLQDAGFALLRREHYSWQEEPHPGFRDEVHQHASHVFLLQRPPAADPGEDSR